MSIFVISGHQNEKDESVWLKAFHKMNVTQVAEAGSLPALNRSGTSQLIQQLISQVSCNLPPLWIFLQGVLTPSSNECQHLSSKI